MTEKKQASDEEAIAVIDDFLKFFYEHNISFELMKAVKDWHLRSYLNYKNNIEDKKKQTFEVSRDD